MDTDHNLSLAATPENPRLYTPSGNGRPLLQNSSGPSLLQHWETSTEHLQPSHILIRTGPLYRLELAKLLCQFMCQCRTHESIVAMLSSNRCKYSPWCGTLSSSLVYFTFILSLGLLFYTCYYWIPQNLLNSWPHNTVIDNNNLLKFPYLSIWGGFSPLTWPWLIYLQGSDNVLSLNAIIYSIPCRKGWQIRYWVGLEGRI